MKKYNNLLINASQEYSIAKGKHETEVNYKTRLVYSIIGRMALASLWDMPDSGDVSIVHVKNRIKELLKCYRHMYPEIENAITPDNDTIADEIYDILLRAGCIYHEPNRIVLSAKCDGCKGSTMFTRGYPLDVKQCISGLGTYQNNIITAKSIKDMFLFERDPLDLYWEICTRNLSWNQMSLDNNTEFLNMSPVYSGYWITKGDTSGKVSLLRIGPNGRQIYYYYKYENDSFWVSQVPFWRVENSYRAMANACLKAHGFLPKTEYVIDGAIVKVRFGYLPPDEELYLWKLYSWPDTLLNVENSFTRVCSKEPFKAIKTTMEELGYEFVEVKE